MWILLVALGIIKAYFVTENLEADNLPRLSTICMQKAAILSDEVKQRVALGLPLLLKIWTDMAEKVMYVGRRSSCAPCCSQVPMDYVNVSLCMQQVSVGASEGRARQGTCGVKQC